MAFIPYMDVARKVSGWTDFYDLVAKIRGLGFYYVEGHLRGNASPIGSLIPNIAEEMGRELDDWTMQVAISRRGRQEIYFFKSEEDALWARLIL